jgi:ABC-type oligopeptide transport system ATPase subunit
MPTEPILAVRDLRREFVVRRSWLGRPGAVVRAVDGVSLSIAAGQTLALVGESGSGKSTLGRCIARLDVPTAGSVRFDGQDVLGLGGTELMRFRRSVQIVFQDPYASLNPRRRVGQAIADGLVIHRLLAARDRRERVLELLRRVGLRPDHAERYPHQFSGGQRQRIAIARALAVSPRFIIADEPVSSLDVSIRAQILNLLAELQAERSLTYLFISHDLGVVRHFADRVAIMQSGRLVEEGPCDQIFADPRHPYTQALLRAVPRPDPARRRRWQGG